tara:strand:+ start:180 stop:659 length:480 start_codon:yes stop_codon:yes gene_type:complete
MTKIQKPMIVNYLQQRDYEGIIRIDKCTEFNRLLKSFDINLKHNGITPLHYICSYISNNSINRFTPKLIQLIINKGGNVNTMNNDGNTIIHTIIEEAMLLKNNNNKRKKYEKDIIKQLIINNLDLHTKNLEGITPIDYIKKLELYDSKRYKHIIEILEK